MAHLGTLPIYTPGPAPAVYPITDYDVRRGRFLGPLPVVVPPPPPALKVVSNYIVRQTGVVYRQLWPSHGQRFPQ